MWGTFYTIPASMPSSQWLRNMATQTSQDPGSSCVRLSQGTRPLSDDQMTDCDVKEMREQLNKAVKSTVRIPGGRAVIGIVKNDKMFAQVTAETPIISSSRTPKEILRSMVGRCTDRVVPLSTIVVATAAGLQQAIDRLEDQAAWFEIVLVVHGSVKQISFSVGGEEVKALTIVQCRKDSGPHKPTLVAGASTFADIRLDEYKKLVSRNLYLPDKDGINISSGSA